MNPTTQQPAKLDFGGLQIGGRESYQSTASLPRPGRAVNHSLLATQAAAAEQRALANAAWHSERAARYLAWTDNTWATERYQEHVAAAEFQQRLAARHAAVLAALRQVRP
jgi:hypothetical protein